MINFKEIPDKAVCVISPDKPDEAEIYEDFPQFEQELFTQLGLIDFNYPDYPPSKLIKKTLTIYIIEQDDGMIL